MAYKNGQSCLFGKIQEPVFENKIPLEFAPLHHIGVKCFLHQDIGVFHIPTTTANYPIQSLRFHYFPQWICTPDWPVYHKCLVE